MLEGGDFMGGVKAVGVVIPSGAWAAGAGFNGGDVGKAGGDFFGVGWPGGGTGGAFMGGDDPGSWGGGPSSLASM